MKRTRRNYQGVSTCNVQAENIVTFYGTLDLNTRRPDESYQVCACVMERDRAQQIFYTYNGSEVGLRKKERK